MDLSLTYGNNDKDAQKLRQFQGGRLRSEIRHGQEWPPRATNASGTCRLQKEEDACYMAGKFKMKLSNTTSSTSNKNLV